MAEPRNIADDGSWDAGGLGGDILGEGEPSAGLSHHRAGVVPYSLSTLTPHCMTSWNDRLCHDQLCDLNLVT